ncbi:SanA/YdcF family protein [Actinomycetes bacterium M1A6_2h]
MKTALVRSTVVIVSAAILVLLGSAAWVAHLSSGRIHDVADAPAAPTVIVLGSQVRDGKPMKFLQGRLDAAIDLVRDGRAQNVLVSGDGNGASGNEIAAMTDYLVAAGIARDVITGDPHGVDTYDTCARAATTYGVTHALIVTQGLHVSRAVALCREKGIDVDGVDASCDCNRLALARNYAREWLARPKVVLDLLSGRDAATP